MTSAPRAGGFTLLEAMIAMAVLLIGSMGMLSLHAQGVRMNADARVMTRATAIAQDLVDQMQAWDYRTDDRLANANDANDADYADTAGAFEGPVAAELYDHEETELEAAAEGWPGISTAAVQQLGFTRYWNVAEADTDVNGVVTGRRVAVIVRWERNGVGRRIVMVTFLRDPQVTN